MTDGLRVRYCLGRDFHQPAAAAAAYFGFGELEEALIHGGGGGVDPGVITKNDVAQAKCKFFFSFSFSSSSCVSPESGLLGYFARKARPFLATRAQRRTGRDMPRLLCSCRLPFLCKQANTVCMCRSRTCM